MRGPVLPCVSADTYALSKCVMTDKFKGFLLISLYSEKGMKGLDEEIFQEKKILLQILLREMSCLKEFY